MILFVVMNTECELFRPLALVRAHELETDLATLTTHCFEPWPKDLETIAIHLIIHLTEQAGAHTK